MQPVNSFYTHICFYILDIDECSESSGPLCQHECVNTPATYHCECHLGYSLLNDGVNCQGNDERWRHQPCIVVYTVCSRWCCKALKALDAYVHTDNLYCVRIWLQYRDQSLSSCWWCVLTATYVFYSDIDECTFNPCNHGCENTEGSYTCLCQTGFIIDPQDPNKCIGEYLCYAFIEKTLIRYAWHYT